MKKYKVREYHKTGANKGNTKRELYFDTLKEADEYYNSVFVYLRKLLFQYYHRFYSFLSCPE